MPRSERDIVIGKIIAPLGTRGEVKMILLTEYPDRFDAGSELTLRLRDGESRQVKVAAERLHKEGLALKLEGIDTRDDAEAVRGAEFIIDVDDVHELPSDKFYVFDLMGLRVVTDDGRECGEVTEVVESGANDVYVTSTGLCIPALKSVVAKIDIGEGVMVIRPVPGLLD
jgi:16S rRNA processing protein RimM